LAGLAHFNRGSIEQFAHRFETAFNHADSEGMASFYAQDATLIADETETLHGRHAIQLFWQAVCARANSLQMKRTIQILNLTVVEDLGYVVGTVRLEVPATEGHTSIITVRYVTIWRCQPDATWQLVMDISNRNPSK